MPTEADPQDEQAAPPRRRRVRLPRIPGPPRFAGRVLRLFRGKPLVLAGMMAVVGAGVTFTGTQALTWMETPEFCGRCHTMTPEVTAHEVSSHSGVECAQCHVGEGVAGLAKAKIGGMRQMLQLILGEYARPIPPAADKMPPATETCERCHDPARERSDLLLTKTHYQDDQANTPQQVGLVLRLSNEGGQPTQGIHWHVLSNVTFATEADGSIPWVNVVKPDGTREQYISASTLEMSSLAGEKAAEFSSSGDTRRMSCYDCHNRVGHDFPTPTQAIDQAMSEKRIDPSIPYIKKNGMELISGSYDSVVSFDKALRSLEQTYYSDYPYLFLDSPAEMQDSFITLRDIYLESDHPAMNAEPKDYPNLLGHTASTGCFRCHDGGHFKIVNGELSKEAIPSRCSACHTFPSVGAASLAPIGQPPTSHADPIWVFNHKDAPGASNPTGSSCAACHNQSYCTNCHSSGVKNINHDQMLVNHAQVIRNVGQNACSYCHQKPFCTRCHTKGVPSSN